MPHDTSAAVTSAATDHDTLRPPPPQGGVRAGVGETEAGVALTRFADVEVDSAKRTVRRAGKLITMKPRELELLLYLVGHPGAVLSRQELLERVWGYTFAGASRTVDVHIRWLRRKLEEDPDRPLYLRTVRGRGYTFVP